MYISDDYMLDDINIIKSNNTNKKQKNKYHLFHNVIGAVPKNNTSNNNINKENSVLFLGDKNINFTFAIEKNFVKSKPNSCKIAVEYIDTSEYSCSKLIDYIKENDIKFLIIDWYLLPYGYENAVVDIYNLSLFFPKLIVVTYKSDIELYSVWIKGNIEYQEHFNDCSELWKLISSAVSDNIQTAESLEDRIGLYCLKRLELLWKNETIKIDFNKQLFSEDDIEYLKRVFIEIITNDSRGKYMPKKLLFDNKEEIILNKTLFYNTKKIKDISNVYLELQNNLLKDVKGQDACVEKVVRALFDAELNHPGEGDKRNLSTLFFFGPPGSGKTFLATKIVEYLGYESIMFHMEDYAAEGDQISLFGLDPQWKNARRGDLINFVDNNSENEHIVIFDEIEKAHPEVINSMLTLLSQGMVHDQYKNKDISLNNSILIFTSNAGKNLYEDTSIKFSSIKLPTLIDEIQNEKGTRDINIFNSEFCSRIRSSNVITFDHLSVFALNNIVKSNLNNLIKFYYDKYNIIIKLDSIIPLISIFHTGKSDARVTISSALKLINDEIFELAKYYKTTTENKFSTIEFEVDFSNIDKEIKSLITRNKKINIAVIGDRNIINKFNLKSKDYEIIQIKNDKDLLDSLRKKVSAYYIDPFYGGVEEESLSITDYNSKGIKYLYKIIDSNGDVPVYVLENNNISDIDKTSLIYDGVKKIINCNNSKKFKQELLDTIDDDYYEEQINTITQKGFVIDYKTKQTKKELSNYVVTLYDFKKYMAYDAQSSKIMLKESDVPNTKFDDVIGCEEAKRELKYYVNYLKNPIEFVVDGAKVPKGVLLFGPPGTGKTMLARAMAGEANINFISTTAADLVGNTVGKGEEKVRDLFFRARKYAPTIIFIDEIDAIGKKRSGSYNDSILTALLTEMDGFKQNTKKPVFVLAATNYGVNNRNKEISELDPALVRRFDSNVYVGVPDKNGRKEYIELFLNKRNIKNIKKGTIDTLANCTVGQSLAIIENILELAFRTAKIQGVQVKDDILLLSLDQYENGEIKERNEQIMKSTAIHEAGHAYVSYICGNTPAYISIEARNNYGGYIICEEDENGIETVNDMLNKINICLAGMIAQEILIDKETSLSTGSYDDLRKASNIALNVVCNLGIDDKLLTLKIEDILSSPLSREYMEKANGILLESKKQTTELIKKHKKQIESLALLLLEKGHITKEELLEHIKLTNKK